MTQTRSGWGRWVAGGVLLVVVGLLGRQALSFLSPREDPIPQERVSSSAATPVGIRTEAVRMRQLAAALRVSGQVIADESRTVRVSPRVGGRIVEAKVKVGDSVQPGDVIATVASNDLAQARSADAQAKAKVQVARANLELQKKLASAGAFTQKQVEDAKHDYQDAQTDRAAAEASVGEAKDALELAKSELARKKRLVELGGLSQKPVEDAKNELSEAKSEKLAADAVLTASKADVERLQRLYVGGVVSKKDVDDGQADYEAKKAAADHQAVRVEIAETALKREQETLKAGIADTSALEQQQNEVARASKDYNSEIVHLQQATERVRVTESALQREQKIADSNLLATKELQAAQADYDSAGIEARSAAETLRLLGTPTQPGPGGTAIIPVRASIRGVVVGRSMNVGEIVDTTTVLATLLDLTTVVVEANLQEGDIGRVRTGASAIITASAYPNARFTGRVSYVSRQIDPDTHTFRARIELPNPEARLRPGMFVEVTLSAGEAQAVLAVPAAAVLVDGDRRVVFVKHGARYDRQVVSAGAEEGGFVPIYSGLRAGEEVVTAGNSLLQAEAGRENGEGD